MTTTEKTPPRERLLDAATRLFYRDGVGTGIEALCREAGVSKRSMYQFFGGKDELMAASLERSAPGYRALLIPEPDGRPARERILHVFRRLETLSEQEAYRGCPLVAMAVEVKDPGHPARKAARRQKQAMTDFFETEATRAGASDPGLLARQLTLAFDGASARAVDQASPLDGLALATANALLNAAGATPA